MSHVFISHSTSDNAITEELVDHLQQAGISTWLDRKNIKSGERWLRSIQKALEACHAVVIVMSRAARDSEWVEREALLAMDLRKPIYIARVEEMPLPLYLINRQYNDFVQDAERAREDLIEALLGLDDGAAPRRLPASRSPLPNQQNFFEYVARLPGGESNEWIARDLFRWGEAVADAVEFGGKITPGFHVRVHIGEADVTVFSLWAYARQPAVQVQLQYLSELPPYDNHKVRLSTLRSLNRLMDEPFLDDRADRRPTLPLQEALNTADKLETFKQIISEIIDNLRSN